MALAELTTSVTPVQPQPQQVAEPRRQLVVAAWCWYVMFLVALLVAGQTRFFKDPGTFWHTVVGEVMLDNQTVMSTDQFTFTHSGQEWLAHQWLGELALAALYRIGGWNAQLLAIAALLAGLYAWLAMRLARTGLNPVAVLMGVLLVIGVSSCHFHVRPQLTTMVGMALTFALLCDVDRGRAPLGRLAWLIPLVLVWTNFHGGVVGGLASVALVFAGWIVACWIGYPSPVKTRQQQLALVGLGIAYVLATLINPWGWRLPALWTEVLGMSLSDIIQEHARLSFAESTGMLTLVMFALYAITLAGLWWGRGAKVARRVLPRISWLLPLVWFYLATDRVRNAPLFALLTMLAIAEMLPFTAWRTWLFRHDWVRTPERSGIYRRSRRATLGMATVATLVLGGAMSAVGWAQLDPQRWPLDLLPELTALDERTPPGEPIFNAMIDGGFLTFHCRGLKTFIDDRCELAGEQTLHAYAEAERNHPAQIDVWQAEYGFEHALVRNDTPFDQHLMLSPDWRVIRRGSCATLYRHVKADPASGSTAYNGRARSTVKPNQPLLRTLINTSDLLKNFGSPQFDKLQS